MLDTVKAKQSQFTAGVRDVFNKASSTYGPFYGLYRGTVINNIDPMELNRLMVDVPTLPCSIASFANPASPYGGLQVGLVVTPPIGASVWVKFENGDPSYPVWVGCFWAEGSKPVLAELPTQQVFSTGSFNAMVNDIPEEAECLMEFAPPGFEVPVTASVNTEAVTLTVGEVIMTATPEEVSIVMGSSDVIMTSASLNVVASAEVAIVATEVSTAGNLTVEGEVTILGDVVQEGAVEVTGDVSMTGALTATGAVNITGAVENEGAVNVLGGMEIQGNLEVAGAIEVEGDVGIVGATEMAGNIAMAGAVEIAGDIALAGAIEVGGVVVSVAYSPGVLNTI